MRGLVRAGKVTMPVRTTALSLIQDLPPKAYINEIERLWEFVRDDIRYVKDVAGVETVQTAERTLDLRQGDCDDKGVLLAALLESIGHPTRFVALAFAPHKFSHVLVETRVGRGAKTFWIPLETTEFKPFGWYPQRPHSRMVVTNS
jgi:transglutaminase-like putative cysteine protease